MIMLRCVGLLVLMACGCVAGCVETREPVAKAKYGKAGPAEEGAEVIPPWMSSTDLAFHNLDRDGDGELSVEEFVASRGNERAVETAKDVFQILDGDKDGKLSSQEFTNRPAEARYREADLDGDGGLSFSEFRKTAGGDWSEARAGRIFAASDQDKDGRLNAKEFNSQPMAARFHVMDRNGDERMSLEEFQLAYAEIAGHGQSERALGAMDRDGNGQLTVEEYCAFSPELQVFCRDMDGDGQLTIEEYCRWCKSPEETAAVKGQFAKCDANRDGRVTVAEFAAGNTPVATKSPFAALDGNGDGGLSLEEYLGGTKDAEEVKLRTDVFALLDANQDGRLTEAEHRSPSPKAAYRMADRNGDGTLDLSEFQQAYIREASEARAGRILAASDQDGDGRLSFVEVNKRPMAARFHWLDQNGDERMSLEEFQGAYVEIARHGQAERTVRAMDRDGDGQVTVAEFSAFSPELQVFCRDIDGDSEVTIEEYCRWCVTPEETATSKGLFAKCDADRNGRVTVAEYAAGNAPVAPKGPLAALDANGDGTLSLEEYLGGKKEAEEVKRRTDVFGLLDANQDHQLTEAEHRSVSPKVTYRLADRNGDGGVDVGEFQQAAMAKASEARAQRVFAASDQDKDGRLNLQEFSKQSTAARFHTSDQNDDERMSVEEFERLYPEIVRHGQAKRAFGALDRDGDGQLTVAEYGAACAELQVFCRDIDGDGQLTLEEYCRWCKSPEETAAVNGQFAKCDANRDGWVTVAEYATGNAPVAAKSPFAALDADGDGKLSLEEYLGGKKDAQEVKLGTDVFALLDANQDGQLTEAEHRSPSPKAAYRLADRNGDGTLDAGEFQQGYMGGASEARAQRILAASDQDGDGRLNFAEISRRSMGARFHWLDQNGDERMSLEEFRGAYAEIARHGQAERTVRAMDRNGDGQVTVAEFSAFSPELQVFCRDIDGDSELTIAEYCRWCVTPEETAANQGLFAKCDADRNGRVTVGEYAAGNAPVAPKSPFAALDANGDGTLSLEEYLGGKKEAEEVKLRTDVFGLLDANQDGQLTEVEHRSVSPKATYRLADRNGDGGIDVGEFRQAAMAKASEARAQRVFAASDQDKDGRLNFEEFGSQSTAARFHASDQNDDERMSAEEFERLYPEIVRHGQAKRAFGALDRDGDGQLTVAEYGAACAELQVFCRDIDGDSELTIEEYCRWCKSPEETAAWKEQFAKCDADRDGRVTVAEYAVGAGKEVSPETSAAAK
ncbi:MAG: EF-hand domain-containing protein [Pirellulales bacterium]|nr:EF-hand domain-containing protein [Pirellulales bacterium]